MRRFKKKRTTESILAMNSGRKFVDDFLKFDAVLGFGNGSKVHGEMKHTN